MPDVPTDLWRVLGKAGRLWARPDLLEVQEDWWISFSGQRNLNYNLACCHSSDRDTLVDRCLEPTLALKRPAIIMLSGPGLANAQQLVDSGWVTVGSLPLMVLRQLVPSGPPATGARPLTPGDLDAAREVLGECYGLDAATAAAAIPDAVAEGKDISAWGLFDGRDLVSCITGVVQDGMVVLWSMATRADVQRQGHGRRLLEAMLGQQLADGAAGALLHASEAGEGLYRELGFTVVEYLQLWSRPRWALSIG
jgi:GNAT superfamily N-acetyltransferase